MQVITSSSAVNSYLITDLVNSNEQNVSGYRSSVDKPEEWMQYYGWKAHVVQPGDQDANYGRFTDPFPSRELDNIRRAFFVSASK